MPPEGAQASVAAAFCRPTPISMKGCMIQHAGSRSDDACWCHVISYLGRRHLIVHSCVFFLLTRSLYTLGPFPHLHVLSTNVLKTRFTKPVVAYRFSTRTLRRSVLVICTWSPVSVFLIKLQYLRIRVYNDVAPLTSKVETLALFRLVLLLLSCFSAMSFSHVCCALNHHRSTDISRDTPCVKCRRLESKMRAFVLSKVHVTHLGFEDAGVAPLQPRFRNFLNEAVKAFAFCLVLTTTRL